MAFLQLGSLGLCVLLALILELKTLKVHGQLICACSTPACNETGRVTCTAVTSCYTQYLDRRDGSSPVTRGCIDDKTPLLCENRRPFVPVTPWPHLRCCKESMCNADIGITVTAPTWPRKHLQSTTAQVFQLDARPHRTVNQPAEKSDGPLAEATSVQHPFFIIVLPAVTLCLFLVLLVLVALVVRQARRRRRTGEFGARAMMANSAGLPGTAAAQCGRGRFYSTGDPYIREKFFSSVPV